MGLQDAYANNHIDFSVGSITYEDDADAQPDPIPSDPTNFEYSAPAISVDTSGRFTTHEIVGGSTVRQKIGEEPIEVSVSGVCPETMAKQLDNLRDARYGTIYSNRLPGGWLEVHFASCSTSPMADGGAVSPFDSDGEFLYTFDLECVEVFTGSGGGGGGGGGGGESITPGTTGPGQL